jgi:PEP-CTERM motif-containing protein
MFRKLYSAALGAAALTMVSTGAHAVPSDATFVSAGLGPSAGWTLVSPETFGSGGAGNGFFSAGGSANFVLRLADFGHIFGTATAGHTNETPIFNTSVDTVGTVKNFVPAANPFLFYFQNTLDILASSRVFSDDVRENDPFSQTDMFVYQQGSTFALFFDDGGPLSLCDDNDANDMVVTVTSAVPEPMSLALFGAGLAGLAFMRRRKTA